MGKIEINELQKISYDFFIVLFIIYLDSIFQLKKLKYLFIYIIRLFSLPNCTLKQKNWLQEISKSQSFEKSVIIFQINFFIMCLDFTSQSRKFESLFRTTFGSVVYQAVHFEAKINMLRAIFRYGQNRN